MLGPSVDSVSPAIYFMLGRSVDKVLTSVFMLRPSVKKLS